ncbi:hypothetical protein ACO0RG_000723 [Hanseniaspora osmophila]
MIPTSADAYEGKISGNAENKDKDQLQNGVFSKSLNSGAAVYAQNAAYGKEHISAPDASPVQNSAKHHKLQIQQQSQYQVQEKPALNAKKTLPSFPIGQPTAWSPVHEQSNLGTAIPVNNLLLPQQTPNLNVMNTATESFTRNTVLDRNDVEKNPGADLSPPYPQSFYSMRLNLLPVDNTMQASFPMTTANSPFMSAPFTNGSPLPAISLPSLANTPGGLPSNTDLASHGIANNNSNQIDSTKLEPVNANGKKKRNKLIKSCLYCRSKKLKCDKKHPICGTCQSRGLTECVYLSHPELKQTKQTLSGHGISESPNKTKRKSESVLLEGHIGDTEENLKQSKKAHLDYPLLKNAKSAGNSVAGLEMNQVKQGIKHEPNKILDMGCLTMKNERYMYFGATSNRASIAQSDASFLRKFSQGWKEFKKERMRAKSLTKRSVLQELRTIERDDGVPILEKVLEDIPKKIEVVECCIDLFFKSCLHEFFNILSEKKVRSDLKRVFEIDEQTGEITKINCTGKKNYYTVGIILVIISNTFYEKMTPVSMLEFYVFLEGFSTGKPMFLERAQFLGLKALYRVLTGTTGGDSSHLMNVVGSLCNTVVGLGFHRNVYKVYEEDVEYVGGDLGVLKNMFYLALMLDLYVSVQYGKPLFISSEVFDEELLLVPEKESGTGEPSSSNEAPTCAVWGRRLRVLKLFLYHMRKAVATLYRPVGTPSIMGLVQDLNDCFENIFLPLDKYFSFKEKEVDIFDYLLLPLYLQLQIALSSIQLSLSDEFTIYFQNNTIKHAFSTMKICAATIKRCYLMEVDFENDNKEVYEQLAGTKFKDSIKPFYLLALHVRYTNLMRSIIEYYKILYKTSTVIKDGNQSLKEILNAFVSESELQTGSGSDICEASGKSAEDAGNIKQGKHFMNDFSLEYFSENAMRNTKYSGLQLYKWFCVLSDVLFSYESKFFKATPKHFPDLFFMRAIEGITRMAFDSFINNLRDFVNGQISEVRSFESHAGTENFKKFKDAGKGSKAWRSVGFKHIIEKGCPGEKETPLLRKETDEGIDSELLNDNESKNSKTSDALIGSLEAAKTNNMQADFGVKPDELNSVGTPPTVDHQLEEANSETLPLLPENLDFFSATFNSDEFSGDLAREIDKMFASFDFDDNNDFDTILNM